MSSNRFLFILLIFTLFFHSNCQRKFNTINLSKNNNINQADQVKKQDAHIDIISNFEESKEYDEKCILGIIMPNNNLYKNIIINSSLSILNTYNSCKINYYEVSDNSDNLKQIANNIIQDNNEAILSYAENSKNINIIKELGHNIPLLAISDSNAVSKSHSNLISFNSGTNDIIKNIFQNMKDNNQFFFSCILPMNRNGYMLDNKIRDYAKKYNIHVINTEFYNKNDQSSIIDSINKLKKKSSFEYIKNDKGEPIFQDIKTFNQNKKKNIENKNNIEVFNGNLDAIFINSNDLDFNIISKEISNIEKIKNTKTFATIDINIYNNIDINNVSSKTHFIGYKYPYINTFHNLMFDNFKLYSFNRLIYTTYDAISFILHNISSNKSIFNTKHICNKIKFNGLLESFSYDNDCNLIRNMSFYSLDEFVH